MLRDFYTKQESSGFGYGVHIALQKELKKSLRLTFKSGYRYFRVSETKMDYYISGSDEYLQSYSSNYKEKRYYYGLGIVYSF